MKNIRNVLIAAALGLVAVVPGLVRGQEPARQPAAKPMTLSAMDYVEIRMLVNRYAFAVDTGSNNGYDYADLFSADGEFMRPYARGREQLAALARGPRLGPLNNVHYIMNHVIEPTPDGAIGKQYLIEMNFDPSVAGPNVGGRGQNAGAGRGRGAAAAPADGPAPNPDAGTRSVDRVGQRKGGELARTGGHYEDVYVKTPVGWRFKKRDFIPSASGADAPPPAPPRVPAAAANQEPLPPLAPAANYVPPTLQTQLTALDYIEIMQLVSSYGHALDSGFGKGYNGDVYANLFAPGASFGGGTGHDGLVKVAEGQPRGPDWVRHYLTNIVVEPTPEGAKGKEYLVEFDNRANGKPTVIFLGGHYEDTYVKTPDGWRFRTRRLFQTRPGPAEERAPR